MLLLDRQSGATAQPPGAANRTNTTASSVQLRLRTDGRVLELLPGRTTIGSSPRCNIRIERPGVQPLHCLIVEGPEGLRVRSWVSDTTLNGARFEESALVAGDCLSLGAVELEIVDPRVAMSQPRAVEVPAAKLTGAEQIRAGRDQSRARSRQLLEALRQERAIRQERCAQLAERNEQLGFEIGELSAQVNELTLSQTEAAKERHELADECAALEEQHRQLIEASNRLQSEIGQVAKEKARADEQIQQLAEEKSRLANEVGHLTNQKAELEDEREGLRRQNEQLLGQARELAGEQSTLSDERTLLCQERSELRNENEALRVRIAQLDEENSAFVVGKVELVDEREALHLKLEQLHARLAELSEENAELEAANASLADVHARSIADQTRLSELERELRAAIADRESTSGELYRALLQLSELQERDDHNQAITAAYESLRGQHDQLQEEANQLKQQINRLSEERSTLEGAWQALSAEAVTLGESQQRLTYENATLVAELDEARQQLERAQQDRATLASLQDELEGERAAKLQAESGTAAVIAEGERRLEEQERRFDELSSQLNDQLRQHAEQSRELAESINMLEQQLAAARDTCESLARARDEAQLHLAGAESVRGEQSRRIQELESQLAAAELAASRSAGDGKTAVPESDVRAAEQGEGGAGAGSEHSAELLLTSTPAAPASRADVNARVEDDAHLCETFDDPATDNATPSASASAGDAWRSIGVDILPSDSAADSNAQPSALNGTAEQSGITFVERVLAKTEESAQRENKTESEPSAKRESKSFIERYSHLFGEDGAASDEKVGRSNELLHSRPIATSIARPAESSLAPKSDEEDSIEQYMAKLLQRVRGDAPSRPAAPTQPSGTPLGVSTSSDRARPTEDSAPLSIVSSTPVANVDVNPRGTQPAESHTPAKRKVSSPAPTTDLGALRALANETARRAIGRHELRKLRRNAVTKVIVATLAGVTSLWLMLDSPDWRSVQFVTGCISLLVAAYWAGETYRTLVESLRAAAYDGPAGAVESNALQAPELPIDVESSL